MAFGDAVGGILIVAVKIVAGFKDVGKDGGFPVDVAGEGFGVRVHEKLVGVEAQAILGLPRPVDAEAIALAGANVAYEAVPDESGALAKSDAVGLIAGLVEKANGYAGSVLRIDGKVSALGGGRGAERGWLTG
jgi:hypothetical protein